MRDETSFVCNENVHHELNDFKLVRFALAMDVERNAKTTIHDLQRVLFADRNIVFLFIRNLVVGARGEYRDGIVVV